MVEGPTHVEVCMLNHRFALLIQDARWYWELQGGAHRPLGVLDLSCHGHVMVMSLAGSGCGLGWMRCPARSKVRLCGVGDLGRVTLGKPNPS